MVHIQLYPNYTNLLDGSKSISLDEFCSIGKEAKTLVPEDQRPKHPLLLENTWQPSGIASLGITFAAGAITALCVYKYFCD